MSSLRTRLGRLSALGRNYFSARPCGVYSSLAELTATPACEAEVREIAPAYKGDETYIDFFGREALDYVPRETQVEGCATRVASIPGGRILSDFANNVAVFTRNNRLVGEVSFQFGRSTDGRLGQLRPNANPFATRVPNVRLRRVNGCVFSLLSGGSAYTYFYHWFLDVLPRLEALSLSGWYNEVDTFLFPSTRLNFQRETLELLGIRSDRVLDGTFWHHLRTDRLIVTSHPRSTTFDVQPWITDYLHQTFDPSRLGLNLSAELRKPLLYVSRGDANYRHVLNEREVIASLERLGFEAVELSRYTLREAIVLFRQARCVVAPHGAGLTNLLFCEPDTQVLELFSAHYVNPYFYAIARKLRLEYEFLRGLPTESGPVVTGFAGTRKDILVDIDALKGRVRMMMSL